MPENKFLDDIAKFGNTTLNAMGTMQKQVRNWVSEQVDSLIKNMDIVTKKEMEARIEGLEKRIRDLEAKKSETKPKTATKAKAKSE